MWYGVSGLRIEMFRMKQPNSRNGSHHVRFRIGRTPIDTVVDMLGEDNNGKNVVLYRTHLRNISDQDFKILEEVYQELGTLYNREKRKHRFDKHQQKYFQVPPRICAACWIIRPIAMKYGSKNFCVRCTDELENKWRGRGEIDA